MKKTLKNIVLATSLAGALAIAGCGKSEDSRRLDREPSKTTYATSSDETRIEPIYGKNKMLIEGVRVHQIAYGGNEGKTPYLEDTKTYPKGTAEYEALRPLLTIEAER